MLLLRLSTKFVFCFFSLISAVAPCKAQKKISSKQFTKMAEAMVQAWNQGDAEKVASYYSAQAVIVQPEYPQAGIEESVVRGREQIFQFVKSGKATLQWNSLGFDEVMQMGFGEFTRKGESLSYHGICVIQIADGLIGYTLTFQFGSTASWEDFARQVSSPTPLKKGEKLDRRQFVTLLQNWVSGWQTGDPAKSADTFTKTATGFKPKYRDGQWVVDYSQGGREATLKSLTEFCKVVKETNTVVSMVWNQIAFDDRSQFGIGEYTFKWDGKPFHGIMLLHTREGLLSERHEYEYPSSKEWKEFTERF
jgi:hypothetical protein